VPVGAKERIAVRYVLLVEAAPESKTPL